MDLTLIEKALTIITATHDGNDLAPQDLKLTEMAVNGRLNEKGTTAFEELYRNVTKPEGYTFPWFHGIEHLTRDQQGYVRWKGRHVEHYDYPYCYSDDARTSAQEVARRCRLLESRGHTPDVHNVIWTWPMDEATERSE